MADMLLPKRGEKVSMGHFKGIEIECINMESIEKGPINSDISVYSKIFNDNNSNFLDRYWPLLTAVGRYWQLFATIRNYSQLFDAIRCCPPLSRLGKASASWYLSGQRRRRIRLSKRTRQQYARTSQQTDKDEDRLSEDSDGCLKAWLFDDVSAHSWPGGGKWYLGINTNMKNEQTQKTQIMKHSVFQFRGELFKIGVLNGWAFTVVLWQKKRDK